MRAPRPALTALLAGTAMLILVQGALAGRFISGTSDARELHLVIGSLLPWYSLAPAIVSLMPSNPPVSAGVKISSWALSLALAVQMVLGHLPAADATAMHVPLGVTLFGAALLLAVGSTRPARRPHSR